MASTPPTAGIELDKHFHQLVTQECVVGLLETGNLRIAEKHSAHTILLNIASGLLHLTHQVHAPHLTLYPFSHEKYFPRN